MKRHVKTTMLYVQWQLCISNSMLLPDLCQDAICRRLKSPDTALPQSDFNKHQKCLFDEPRIMGQSGSIRCLSTTDGNDHLYKAAGHSFCRAQTAEAHDEGEQAMTGSCH